MDASNDSKLPPAPENRGHPQSRISRPWAPPSDIGTGNPNRRPWAPPSDVGTGNRNGRPWASPSDVGTGNRNGRPWTPPSDVGTGNRNRHPWAPPSDIGTGTGNRNGRSWASPSVDNGTGNHNGRPWASPSDVGTGNRNGRPWASPSDISTGNRNRRPWTPPSVDMGTGNRNRRPWAAPPSTTYEIGGSSSRPPSSDDSTDIRVPQSSNWYDRHNYRPIIMDDEQHTVVHTKVTSSGTAVAHFLRKAKEYLTANHVHHHIVGLDTEWRHNNTPGEPRYRIAVLQLCVADICLLFQIHNADYIPMELRDFLADPEYCFAAVAVDGDVKRLVEDCGLQVANTVDLPKEAAEVLGRDDLKRSGLATLARELMGVRVDKCKKVTMSNWAARCLSPQQVRYACIDAFVSYDVGRRLRLHKLAASSPERPSPDAIDH